MSPPPPVDPRIDLAIGYEVMESPLFLEPLGLCLKVSNLFGPPIGESSFSTSFLAYGAIGTP